MAGLGAPAEECTQLDERRPPLGAPGDDKAVAPCVKGQIFGLIVSK